jgi:hypothetical protein
LDKIIFDLEEKKENGFNWDAENNIRINFGYKRITACLLCRLAEGTWTCKLDQINAYPKRNWY